MKKNDFAKEMYVNLDDKDLINVSNIFLKNIEKEFIEFKEKYNEQYLNLCD